MVREDGKDCHVLEPGVAMGGLGLGIDMAGSCSPPSALTWGCLDGLSDVLWSCLT